MSTLINLILALVLNITGVEMSQQQQKAMALQQTIELCCEDNSITKNELISKENHTNEY